RPWDGTARSPARSSAGRARAWGAAPSCARAGSSRRATRGRDGEPARDVARPARAGTRTAARRRPRPSRAGGRRSWPGTGRHRGVTPAVTALPDAVGASVRGLGSTARRERTRTAHAEIFGAGPLQRFLDEPGVTDVLVNGPDDVWVDRGAGLERVDVALGGPEAVRALAVRLAAAGGQRLDDRSEERRVGTRAR